MVSYPRIGGCVSPDHRNSPSTGLYDVNLFMSLVTWPDPPEFRMTLSHGPYSVGVVYAALSVLGGFITSTTWAHDSLFFSSFLSPLTLLANAGSCLIFSRSGLLFQFVGLFSGKTTKHPSNS
jgi:hypothetical protein